MNTVSPFTPEQVKALVAFHKWGNEVLGDTTDEASPFTIDYAAYVEADALEHSAYEEAAARSMSELSPIETYELLGVNDYVQVKRFVRREDAPDEFGYVRAIRSDICWALVQFENSLKREWFDVAELALVLNEAALELTGEVEISSAS